MMSMFSYIIFTNNVTNNGNCGVVIMSKVSSEHNFKNEMRFKEAVNSICRALEGTVSSNIREILEDVFKIGRCSYSSSLLV